MRFLTAPVCVLLASALAGAKAQLKNMLKTIGFYDIICVCAVCARSANILQTERKLNKQLSKCKPKTPCHGSSNKNTKKQRFGGQNGPQNRPRRPPGAPWAPPARHVRAKNSAKALLAASRSEKKIQAQTKTGPRAPQKPKMPKNRRSTHLPLGRVGGRGAARKSLPGG